MPAKVSYVTKVSEITAVEFSGRLAWVPDPDPDRLGGWKILPISGTPDDLEEWLERFNGRDVEMTIRTFERDESHLLPDNERTSG